ncbi:Ribonucleotide reductase of class II (coenzyme B12-dependent) [hydrothermal vent metagenome]|uniref:ribonucleoside-diphosphate reductase n=1 Tax=hydrothermal vent metagenome TaxID=652676 RepID=A0A3B1CUN8_9ZZZZ
MLPTSLTPLNSLSFFCYNLSMLNLTGNALRVLSARYLLKNEKGEVFESPEGMFRRVASHVARAEGFYGEETQAWEQRFFTLMTELKFLPNSPTLMNAGKEIGQLAACFVLPVDDSMKSIFDTLKNTALILQSGGGTGFSFSRLRPRSDIVRTTGGIASGPVSFMKIYNTATEVIKQGGARRGANMGILRIDHPDILDFIEAKRSQGELTNFNISVAVTDAFMAALKKDTEYELVNPRTGKPVGRLRARTVFDAIVSSAHETGDPGLVFIDRINRFNPTPHLGEIESTNPCGEQPLLPYEACVLGSMNLSKYVRNSIVDNPAGSPVIDYESLGEDIRVAVRFLDDCIDTNRYPLPEIERMHKGNRKIGLGVMGWADMLVLLGIRYNSDQGFSLAREVMRFIQTRSREASAELAGKRGVFPNFKGSVYDAPGMPKVRNATTTTIAPTGTISIIADCSSGIEPIFALAYRRLILDTELVEVNKYFFALARKLGFYSRELEKKVLMKGRLRGIREVPAEIKRLFKTAHEIPPKDHIEMQAAFQEYTDNAVSKTVNLPKSAKRTDVEKAFLLAYEKGCKGVTVFRYGARKTGTLMRLMD